MCATESLTTRQWFLKSLFTLPFILSATIANANPDTNESRYEYDIYSNGKVAGVASRQVNIHETGTEIRETATYSKPGILERTPIILSRIEQYTSTGRLLSADIKHNKGKAIYWSRTESVDGEIWSMASPITSAAEKEDAQFINLVLAALGGTSSGAGEILALSSLLFWDSKAAEANARFPDTDYHTTLQFLPMHWLNAGKTLPDQLDIFDLARHQPETAKIIPFIDPDHPGDCYRLEPAGMETLTLCLSQEDSEAPHFSLLRRSTFGNTVEFRLLPRHQPNDDDKPQGKES